MDAGAPISYLTLEPGTPVYTREASQLGEVKRVLADEEKDIFDGLVVGTADGDRYVEGAAVREIFERGVMLELSAAQAADLPQPEAGPG
jgi:hypothetical protein